MQLNEEDRAWFEEFLKRQKRGYNQLLNSLFAEQKQFITSSARRKAAICSRRAGKTYAAAVYLLCTAQKYPGCLSAYLATSRTSAKRILWHDLLELNAKYNLSIEFNHTDLIAVLPNKSRIWLSGASDTSEIEKFRGSKYKLVILDESASFGSYIEQLVDEVFEPALIDQRGTMVLIGTPVAACKGKFYDVTTDENLGWETHHWTLLNNPHIPHAQEYLESMCKERNWDADNPIYQREWLGRWVRNSDSMVYKYDPLKNGWDKVLPSGLMYVMGVDFGYEDASAFVIGAFTPKKPYFYIIETFKQSQMIPTEIANKIKHFMDKYKLYKIVVDTGGLGKSLAEEFRQRHSLPVDPAEKKNKYEYIELMNDDFLGGFIKVDPKDEITDEWSLLQWDDEHDKEDERFENHLTDACLYAWRESRHFTHVPEPDKPKFGTDAYWEAEERKMLVQAEELREKEDNADWWETLDN
jgi:hypothetical protein